jgi:hypothetical protein
MPIDGSKMCTPEETPIRSRALHMARITVVGYFKKRARPSAGAPHLGEMVAGISSGVESWIVMLGLDLRLT